MRSLPARTLSLICGVGCLAILVAAAPEIGLAQEASIFPSVPSVESQPLLSQVGRLAEGMDYIGSPLPAAAARRLKPVAGQSDRQVASRVQAALDPLCVAAIEIDKNQKVRVVAASRKPDLIEQGWRTYLVKVVNRAAVTTTLRVSSPNAQDVPGSPQDEVARRWLGVIMFNGRPLTPNLSGLELEYRVIQLYSRDAGARRVYVKVPGRLNYDAWCEGIRAGRSYVSDGSCHLMDFNVRNLDRPAQRVDVGQGDSELRVKGASRLQLSLKAAVRTAADTAGKVPVEVVVNGYPVARQMISGDGALNDLNFEVKLDKSSWVAVRVFPSGHTNPVFVVVDDKPIRANRHSAQWLLRGVDECWKQKRRTYAKSELPAAEKAYQHARTVYRQIISESN